jgi:hypothetical protein
MEPLAARSLGYHKRLNTYTRHYRSPVQTRMYTLPADDARRLPRRTVDMFEKPHMTIPNVKCGARRLRPRGIFGETPPVPLTTAGRRTACARGIHKERLRRTECPVVVSYYGESSADKCIAGHLVPVSARPWPHPFGATDWGQHNSLVGYLPPKPVLVI